MHAPSQIPDKIIRTASRLFSEDGFTVGIDRIIAEAQIAKMSLYKFFPSKELLITAVLKSAHEELMNAMMIESPISDQERLNSALEAFMKMSSQSSRGFLITQAIFEFPTPRHSLHKLAVELRFEVAMFLEQLIRLTNPRCNSEKAAQEFQAILEGFCSMSSILGTEEATEIAWRCFKSILSRQ